MTALFVLCVLLFAYVEASHFLSTSTSISPDASTTSSSTNLPAASPACFQPRALNDPPASQLSSALTDASAVAYACSNTTFQRSNNDTIYSNTGAFFFNITRKSGDRNSGFDEVQPSFCAQYFQNIINICLLQQSFWGGWTLVGSANWSVSNSIYPDNLLPIPRAIASSTIGQLPKTQNGTALFTNNISTPASTALSENPSGLILAIEIVVSNAKVSLNAAAAATSKTNDSIRSTSAHQSRIQLSMSANPSSSPLSISIDTSTIASQDNYSKTLASGAPKTEESKISSPAASVSLSDSSTQTSGLQISTIASLLESSVGVNGSAKIPPISGPLTVAPDYTITDAFRANLSITTVSANNGAVLVYSMQTFSDLANKTGAPTLLQTTVPETLSNGSHVTFIGGVWVASGGRYWFPPGIPKLETGGGLKPGIVIRPPCIWPFCSGIISSDGGGGGDPKGNPPPPFEPPTPPPPYVPPGDGSEDESDQETQDGHTQTELKKSQKPSQSAQKITGVSSQTFTLSLSSSSTVPSVTMASSSKVSSSIPDHSTTELSSVTIASTSNVSSFISDYSTTKFSSVTVASTSKVSSSMPASSSANLFDGFIVDYNLSIADAKAAALDELSLINAVTVPQGILWVPTGPQELAYAAQATSPFDLALPTFTNFTQVPSLSSTTDSIAPQNSTGFKTQTASSSAALASVDANADAVGREIAAFAFQIASAAAHQPPSSDSIPPRLTPPPATASALYSAVPSAPTPPPTTSSSLSNPLPPAPTPPSSEVSPITLFECTQL